MRLVCLTSLGLFDGDLVGGSSDLEILKDVLEECVVRRAVFNGDTNGRVVSVLPLSTCIHQVIIYEDVEKQGSHLCIMWHTIGVEVENGDGLLEAYN